MLHRLASRTWSSGALIVASALFVALFSNGALFAEAYRVYGLAPDKLPFLASLFLYVTAVLVLVLAALCHRALVKPVLIAFLLLSSVLAYFATTYGTIFDFQMIANVLETDAGEARDLWNPRLLAYAVLLGVLPSLMIAKARLIHRPWRAELVDRIKLAAVAGAVLALVYAAFGAHYAAMMREHREVANRLNPTFALYSAFKLAGRSLPHANAPHRVVGRDAEVPPTDVHRELVIMVVGETARADHWALNGYPRETTPRLAREDVINFPDFWSCDTSTAKSVPCMFSNLGRARFSRERAKSEDNALDILARAGVSVLWRDNNSSSKGVADRVRYEDFQTPATNPMCEGGECRDEGMLAGLQDYIDGEKGDILIVLHQMGNHGPAYYKRYPKGFEHFTPVCRTNDLGACSPQEINNAYDNALRYTDHFLGEVIALLKRNDHRFETAMVYVSDHGESLGEYGLYLHATPYLLAPDAQKHVPAVIWLGVNKKPDVRLEGMDERRKQRWTHDSIFSTLLGMFEIQSAVYDPNKDLLVQNPEETAGTREDEPSASRIP